MGKISLVSLRFILVSSLEKSISFTSQKVCTRARVFCCCLAFNSAITILNWNETRVSVVEFFLLSKKQIKRICRNQVNPIFDNNNPCIEYSKYLNECDDDETYPAEQLVNFHKIHRSKMNGK